MSAFGHLADIAQRESNVRFWGEADMARPPLGYGPVADDPKRLSARADIYFPLYVPPLRRAAQSADHLLKGIGVFGGVLEPSQEVEWLSKFSAVMQTSRYGRQVFHTNSNVPRLLLEDSSPF